MREGARDVPHWEMTRRYLTFALESWKIAEPRNAARGSLDPKGEVSDELITGGGAQSTRRKSPWLPLRNWPLMVGATARRGRARAMHRCHTAARLPPAVGLSLASSSPGRRNCSFRLHPLRRGPPPPPRPPQDIARCSHAMPLIQSPLASFRLDQLLYHCRREGRFRVRAWFTFIPEG